MAPLPSGQTDEYGAPKKNRTINVIFGGPPIKRKEKIKGGLLRYPYEALTDKTDYLQIDIVEYSHIGESLVSPIGESLVSRDRNRSIRGNSENFNFNASELPQKTKLKKNNGTIILPMPSNIQDGNSVDFAASNLDGLTAAVYGGVMNAIKTKPPDSIMDTSNYFSQIVESVVNPFAKNANGFKKAFLAQIAAQAANIPLGGSLTRDAVFARQSGEILNQNVELLFNGVNLRSFKFSFKLTPRGPEEAQQVKLIINAFKRNMAAKIGSENGIFLGTPNVFELTYKQGQKPHPFLHSFKQCVLTDMSVNYTGEGTYAVYNDSTPVSMSLELGFKELEPIYDTDYNGDDNLAEGVGY